MEKDSDEEPNWGQNKTQNLTFKTTPEKGACI